MLLALWLYATIEGVGSARALDRLSQTDLAYRWLRGGVPVDYHTLSDLRSDSGQLLDQLLSQSLTALMAEGLVRLDEVIIDGTKVRAAAGRGSFKTADGLVELAQLADAKSEVDADPTAHSRRRQAAQERAAREAGERAARAKAMLDRLEAEKKVRAKTHKAAEAKKAAPSASTTDPEARMMRFADGESGPSTTCRWQSPPIMA